MSEIVIVLSSDDEEPAPKRIKCEVKLSTKINKETNVVVIDEDDDGDDEEDDDIICMGDAISEQTTAVSPNNKASVESLVPKSVRRIELTTLSSKIDNETKTDVIQIDDTNKVNEESIKMSLVSFQEPVSSSGIPAEEESSSSKEEREFVPEFNDFIATCLQCECSKKYKDMIKKKIPTLMAKYMELDEEYVTSKKFKNLLKYSSDNMQRKPSNAIIHFNDVYQELRCNNIGELKLTETQFRHLDMLNRAMSKVHKRILRLESRDAQLHDENNSVYIMVARYHERLCTIYKKICNITGENIHSSRYLYKNLDMNSSRYQEINKAVDRLYYKTKTFPSYYDMDKCVRQCVEKNQLKINGAELELEVQKLFKDAGDIIQRRRKYELFEDMSYYTEDDPEPEDEELEELMNMRLQEREKQINKVIDDYTYKQSTGIDIEVSPDSEDSNLKTDEETD